MAGKNYEKLQQSHPCFGQHRNHAGRIHLPVSPGCNIACRFCERSINDSEERPGVTANVLSPEETIPVLARALAICPELRVAGIAGPGDTLATDRAVETFRLIREHYPALLCCMSTNGLLLDEKIDELIDIGLDSLTVTVNAVDPVIEAELNDYIIYHGRRYDGVEGAEILIRHQLNGIRLAAEAGMTVKVNTVLVPGINDGHIAEIASTVSHLGATIYNIIPLIPQAKLAHIPAPDCMMIEKARQEAGRYIDVFRHCQHCRADAVGVPGESEYKSQVYGRSLTYDENFSHG